MPDTKSCPQCGRTYSTDDRFCTVDGAALLSSGHTDSLIGAVLAERYLVQEKLGEGGMGEVYLAEHVRMKRKVAVKLMRSWMVEDPVAVSRFHREAENASQITHPNVAQVYDFGETADGMIYLAMEFVPGEPLSHILEREGRLYAVRAAEIVRQTAEALVAAHHMGILHRDLKPDNVMIARTRAGTDIVKLVDFGIARAIGRGTQQFTSTGMIVGTPDYMSPEQLAGDVLDERSDQYALALIAFRAIAGHEAFPEGATGEALMARLTNNSRRLSAVFPGIQWPAALQAVFDKALAADPAQRFTDALEFATELDVAAVDIPLTDEAEAYLAALSQRVAMPGRLAVIPEGATPPTPMRAATAAESPSPSVRLPRVTPPRAPTPSVPLAAVPESVAETGESNPAAAGALSSNGGRLAEIDAAASGGGASKEARRPGTALPLVRASSPPKPGKPFFLGVGIIAVAALLIVALRLRSSSDESLPLPLPTAEGASPGAPVAYVPVPSNDSTSAAAAPPASPADSDRIARAPQGVFAVASSAGRSTAFLVDGGGIVLTSASVLPRDPLQPVELYLEADRKVRGTRLSVDSANGVAALLVSVASCRRCKALDVLPADSAVQLAEGDSIVAFPVTGRATPRPLRAALGRVGVRALVPTVRIPPASAGAPVLAYRSGNVVAIAAGPPERAGSLTLVPAAVLRAQVASARAKVRSEKPAPNDTVYWSWPARAVPEGELRAARSRPESALQPFRVTQNGYTVLAMTPEVVWWRMAQSGAGAADTLNPFAIPDPQAKATADPVLAWRPWFTYHDERRAVVILEISPERAAYPTVPGRMLETKDGDFLSMQPRRDGVPLLPIESQRVPAVANVTEYRRRNRGVPNAGIYVFHPMDFAPRGATYQLEIVDGNQTRRTIVLPATMIQAIAGDLGAWQTR